MRTAALVSMVTVAALSACGGGSEPLPDLNPALGGTWTGNTVVSIPGFPSSTYASQLELVVTGTTATISKVCPDGFGAVTATGSGNAAAWTGTLACPPVATAQCAAVTSTLKSANGTLSADGLTLTAVATGTAAGCGLTVGATLTFTGTK
jgi:hypothetical protein